MINHFATPTRRHGRLHYAAIVLAIASADLTSVLPIGTTTDDAQARLGRPWTPVSAAGVARRTVRRSAIYVAGLPANCVRVSVNGVVVWQCGPTYYQPYKGRYVVVYVN
jgi:hypothetical protein